MNLSKTGEGSKQYLMCCTQILGDESAGTITALCGVCDPSYRSMFLHRSPQECGKYAGRHGSEGFYWACKG